MEGITDWIHLSQNRSHCGLCHRRCRGYEWFLLLSLYADNTILVAVFSMMTTRLCRKQKLQKRVRQCPTVCSTWNRMSPMRVGPSLWFTVLQTILRSMWIIWMFYCRGLNFNPPFMLRPHRALRYVRYVRYVRYTKWPHWLRFVRDTSLT